MRNRSLSPRGTLYRLTTETVTGGTGPQYVKTFTYDAVSNRSRQVTTGFGATTVDYTYDDRQRLLTENGVALSWDDNGNMLGKAGGDQYTWDFENQLVRVTKLDGSVLDNTYDADGVLVRTSVTPAGGGAAILTDLVVDTAGGLSHVVAEVQGGAAQVMYVRAGDALLEEIRGGVPNFFEAEGIGSVRSLLDASGARTDTWTYSAFGESLARSGTSAQPYQFAGERNVASAGLYQNRARWLSTSTGRFVSVDPLRGFARLPITTQPYLYAGGEPVRGADPSGKEFTISGAQFATIGLAVLATTAGVAYSQYVSTGSTQTAGGLRSAEDFIVCWGDCIERGRLGGDGMQGAALSLLAPAFSALPKEVFGVRPRGFGPASSSPGRNITNILSALAGKLKSWGIIERAAPLRAVGDRFSRVATPITIFEGFFDWGVIADCAFECDEKCEPR